MPMLVTGDWHLDESPQNAYRWQTLKRLLRYVLKTPSVDTLAILGDLTSAKDHHSAALTNLVVEFLSAFAERVRVIVLRGNHDAADTSTPFFQFVHLLPNVDFIHEPTTVGNDLYLPWAANVKDWDSLALSGYDTIYAHNTFSGAKGSSGFVLSGFDVSIFPDNARVISGDVHVPQQVGPVTYVGAPYTVDFGDTFTPRVLLVEPTSMRSFKMPGPRKVLIEITDLYKLNLLKAPPGDIAKIRVHVPPEESSNWQEIRRDVRAWGAAQGIDVWAVIPVTQQGLSLPLASSKRHILSDSELVRAYAERAKVDAATTDAGVKLCEEVA